MLRSSLSCHQLPLYFNWLLIWQNAKPGSKRSTAAKENHVIPIKAATKTAAKKTSRAAKPAATTVPATPPKSRTAENKYHSAAKKARTTGSSTRRTVERKAATAQGTAKKVYAQLLISIRVLIFDTWWVAQTATGRSTPSKIRRGAISAKRTTRATASKQRARKTSRK